ncbi:MAG TPA: hypothetical protein VN436_09255, partial [Holophaga sp.]|nr:hypothetical protein [Holophaga sp.]
MKLRAGCLAFGLAAAALAATIRLEGGPFAPYRINQGRLVLDEGLLGDVELTGRRWSGTRVPLFRTRLAARTQALDLAFYLDEDIRELEVRTGYGEAFPLALETSSPGPAEAAVRARLHDLEPPVRLASREAGPQRFAFRTRGLPEAGIEAASSLFGVPPPRAPLVVLGIFGGIVLAGSVLRSRRQAWAVTVLATAGAAGAVLFLAAPRAAW